MTRSVLRVATVAIGVVAATATVVVRQEECRTAGVRCAGAEGFPFVEYDLCCEGLSCAGFSTSGDYGTFCVDVANPGEFSLTPVDAAGETATVVPSAGTPDEPAAVVPNTGAPDETEDDTVVTEAVVEDAGAGDGGGDETVVDVTDVVDEDPAGASAAPSTAAPVEGEAGEAGVTEAPTTTDVAAVGDETTTPEGEDLTEEDDDTDVGAAGLGGLPDDAEETSEEDAETGIIDTAAEETLEDDEDDAVATFTVDPVAEPTDDDLPEASIDEDGNIVFPDGRASASDEDDDDDGSVCFPASATVELQNGDVVPMDSLAIGDVVKVGVNEYSRVFMFTHKMADATHKFVTLKTESGATLSLTDGHYLYVNGALVAAKTVKVGDTLTLGNGDASVVSSVGAASDVGLFNPQTVNGNVVVNGVLASTYTTAVEPTFAHAILAPFRLLNNFGFQFTALESGGGVLADVAPRGQAVF